MSTTTIEEQLAKIRQRVASLRVRLHADGRAERPRIERHLDALHQEEESLRGAARNAPDEVEERLGRLKTRLDVAEHALAADSSRDWETFAGAVEAELRSWDTYLERLQTSAASRAWKAREQAEGAIGNVRTRRIAVDERLAEAREAHRRRVARAEGTGVRGPRRAGTEGRRAVGDIAMKGVREMNLEAQLNEGEQILARIWKVTALRGILAIAFAVVILVWPSIGLTALIALFGAFALVSGVTTIVGAFSVGMRGGDRAWFVVDGLLGVVVGVVVFVWPALSALGLLYAVAAWAIATGILEMSFAFVVPVSGGRRLLLLVGGLLSVAFGVIMFGHPGAGAVALLALIGAFAFVTGVMQIALAIELRSVAAEVKRHVRPLAKPHAAAHA